MHRGLVYISLNSRTGRRASVTMKLYGAVVWTLLVVVYGVKTMASFEPRSYDANNRVHDHAAAGAHFDRLGDYNNAIRAFMANTVKVDTAASWNDLGVAYMHAQQLDNALRAFERALWLNPDNEKAYDNRHILEEKLGNVNKSGSARRKQYFADQMEISDRIGTEAPRYIEQRKTLRSQSAFLDFVGSKEFEENYFERWPLFVRGVPNMFQWTFSTNRLVSDWYRVGNGGYKSPYRNVNFLKGSLAKRNGDPTLPQGFALGSGLLDALRQNYSIQLLHAEHWVRSLARFCTAIMEHSRSISSVNVYVTPPGMRVATPPHIDFTGSWMVQLSGRKRWRLWRKEQFFLPVKKRHIIGRDEGDAIDEAKLGEPYLEAVLEPGDSLWVPRGCIHSTSTYFPGEEAPKGVQALLKATSMHLTTHVARLHDFGGREQIIPMGLGGFQNPLFESRWENALNTLYESNVEFRRGLNFRDSSWKENLKSKMHALVDEMMDSTDYLEQLERQSTLSVDRRMKIVRERVFLDENEIKIAGSVPSDTLGDNMVLARKKSGQSLPTVLDYSVDPFAPSTEEGRLWDLFGLPSSCPGKWAKHQRPKETNNNYATIPIPFVGIHEVSPSLYGKGAPIEFENGPGLKFTCVFTKSPGGCVQVRDRTGDAAAGTAVVALQYKRIKHLGSILNDLRVQTAPVDLFIMNNNVAYKSRCRIEYEVQKFLRKVFKKNLSHSFNSIWVHHSPVNIGPKLSYIGATAIAGNFNQIIFLDDDVASPANMIESMARESDMFPGDVFSTWALKFLNLESYWDRTGSVTHEEVTYCGSAQMAVPASMFRPPFSLEHFFNYFPPRFRTIPDLWFNVYATDFLGSKLRRSSLPEHSSLDIVNRKVALSTKEGMRDLKTEFLQFITTQSDNSTLQRYFQNIHI